MQRAAAARVRRTVYPVSLGKGELESLRIIAEKIGVTKAEAIREAIRAYSEDVKGLEVIRIRSVSKQEAKKEILEYLKKHDRAWTSDIADSLNLDIVFVNSVLEELWRDEKVEQPSSK